MSKSRGNVVDPDGYIDLVGADNLRLHLLFCSPWEEGGDFNDKGLMGVVRFTRRVARLIGEQAEAGPGGVDLSMLDRLTARVERDVERFKFNTAISALMETTSWAVAARPSMSAEEWSHVASTLVRLLAPFAPHLAEELWSRLGRAYSVHQQAWPSYRLEALAASEVTLVVQVNGKLRARLRASAGLGRAEALELALAQPSVAKYLPSQGPSRLSTCRTSS